MRKVSKVSVVVAMFLALLTPAVAHADGFIIPDDPQAYNRLAEDQQIVVVNIRPDRTAEVDVFVSFSDREGKTDEVTYVLPLDGEPRGFSVKEESRQQFEQENTAALDQFIQDRNDWPAKFRHAMSFDVIAGNLVIGQPLYALAPFIEGSTDAKASSDQSDKPGDTNQVKESEHTRAQLISVSSAVNMGQALFGSSLPDDVRFKAKLVAGQHPQMIRLRIVPVAERQGLNDLGLHISYAVPPDVTDRGYLYWYSMKASALLPSPVALTKIYVSSPERLEPSVSFPSTGDKTDYAGITQGLTAVSQGQDVGSQYYISSGEDPKGKVDRAIYVKSNAGEDVQIVEKDRSPDSWFLIGDSLSHYLLDRAWAGFFALSILIWPFLWQIVGGRLLGVDYRKTRFRAFGDSVGAYFIYATTALVFLMLAMGQLILFGRVGGGSGGLGTTLGSVLWAVLAIAGFVVGAFAASQALRRWRGLMLPRKAAFLRFLAFAALVPIVYNVAALAIMYALWQLV